MLLSTTNVLADDLRGRLQRGTQYCSDCCDSMCRRRSGRMMQRQQSRKSTQRQRQKRRPRRRRKRCIRQKSRITVAFSYVLPPWTAVSVIEHGKTPTHSQCERVSSLITKVTTLQKKASADGAAESPADGLANGTEKKVCHHWLLHRAHMHVHLTMRLKPQCMLEACRML